MNLKHRKSFNTQACLNDKAELISESSVPYGDLVAAQGLSILGLKRYEGSGLCAVVG